MRISRDGTQTVEFVTDWHGWKAGDVAEFDAGIADAFIYRRVARNYVPPKDAPPAKKKPQRATVAPKETRSVRSDDQDRTDDRAGESTGLETAPGD